jgi:hypothetical protein
MNRNTSSAALAVIILSFFLSLPAEAQDLRSDSGAWAGRPCDRQGDAPMDGQGVGG